MKHIALLSALASSCVFASPSWYGEVPSDTSLSYGFGQGSTYQQAKNMAYYDLAKTIESRVISDTSSSKEYKDGQLSKSASSSKRAISDVVFRNNVTVSKSEEQDGLFYLEVQYDPTSFAQKLSQWLEQSTCRSTLHPYWSQAAMLQNWVQQHQCLPNIDIERFAGGWQLTNSAGHLVLPEAQYNHLFFNHPSKVLHIESTNTRLKAGDYYFIKLTAEQSGYLSLFQVYEDGSTGVLIENKRVTESDHIEFPDKKFYDGIEALLNQGRETYDTNVALLCPQRIDTSRFEKLDESRLSTDTPGFGLILKYLDHCEFVMERLSISKS
ncbi:LPP20 family lipoprotein [Photobacterium rosenbergii]|uniref:LPP20 family lipoprotein n=1 Tax=Photobacterium rosenbergii TaxID=294936 RepID=A0ABU3ZD54_9GAMM|nr:LPP20 family lipoprotein [Photobacterium rosenbergii]MDV5168050.1 LPP20 family lipoprotein [Photobacterium rosenbergii]